MIDLHKGERVYRGIPVSEGVCRGKILVVDGAERELGGYRRRQLPRVHDGERRAETLGDGNRDGDAAARDGGHLVEDGGGEGPGHAPASPPLT